MLDGRIPNLIGDVLADDRTASLPVSEAGTVGAFASVPLTFADGRVYGALCAASHDAKSFTYQTRDRWQRIVDRDCSQTYVIGRYPEPET
jgi:hypothetical protein